jgi:Right handed beta helix region
MTALYRTSLAGIAALACLAGVLPAQTIVTGTGNPVLDIAAVQAAVDRGGSVVLRGHFSFDSPPARRGKLPDLMAMVVVSKAVAISGDWDSHGEMTAIEGGEIPFAVEARGAEVRIERLRFVRPKLYAIFVDQAAGLAIESCTIENVEPRQPPGNSSGLTSALGIYVSTVLGLPNPQQPGIPANVFGKLAILNNRISVGRAPDHGIGIMVVNVGVLENPVEVDISGNTIRDTAQKGINVTQIVGEARLERNSIVTAVDVGHGGGRTAAIHCGGTGSYRIAHNRIDVADPNGAGIRLRGYPKLGASIERAIVTDNDLTMSAPEGSVLGVGSVGIEVMGVSRGNLVAGNRIRGRARVALSVAPDQAGDPVGNTFDRNDHVNLIGPRDR